MSSSLSDLKEGYYSNIGSAGTNNFSLNCVGKQVLLTFHFYNAGTNANVALSQSIPVGYRPQSNIITYFTGCDNTGGGMVTGLTIETTGKISFVNTIVGFFGSGAVGWKLA